MFIHINDGTIFSNLRHNIMKTSSITYQVMEMWGLRVCTEYQEYKSETELIFFYGEKQ